MRRCWRSVLHSRDLSNLLDHAHHDVDLSSHGRHLINFVHASNFRLSGWMSYVDFALVAVRSFDYECCLHMGSAQVFRWKNDFDPTVHSPLTPVWIGFAGLPIHLFEPNALFSIGNLIGTPLKMDHATLMLSRPSVARLCIELDLTKELPRAVSIHLGSLSFLQLVSYEDLPDFCKRCKTFGHTTCKKAGKATRWIRRDLRLNQEEDKGGDLVVQSFKPSLPDLVANSSVPSSSMFNTISVNVPLNGSSSTYADRITQKDMSLRAHETLNESSDGTQQYKDCPDHVTPGNDDLNSDPKFSSMAADSANHNENKDDFDFHGSHKTTREPNTPTSLAPLGNDEQKSDPVTTYPNKYTDVVPVSTAPGTPVQLSTNNLDVQVSTIHVTNGNEVPISGSNEILNDTKPKASLEPKVSSFSVFRGVEEERAKARANDGMPIFAKLPFKEQIMQLKLAHQKLKAKEQNLTQTSTVSKCIPTGCSSAPTTNQFDPLEDIPDDDPLLEEHLEDDFTIVRSKKANKKEAPDMTIQTRSGRAPHGPRGQNPRGRCRGRHSRGAI
ncbi:unnamed protein product [Cuscuta campestris]|uniref:Uncharacterized protein n=2 Tax=Cuscuta sect. Cleistogrammica TaxID=1824901 RepID=A0A484LSJ5_9ASTE|nr:unnamed protein product [Cuscuta campestris]